MLLIYLQPISGGALDRVHISRVGADLRLDLAGRRSAVAWLTSQGCCPGAAAMLHGADYGPLYKIAEPGDPSFVVEVDEPSERCPLPAGL
jgi:hypothetical protein